MGIGVVFAEDNYLVREGVRQLIEAQDGIDLLAARADLPSLETAAWMD
jgi:DNA-binding NarL/FixJ family response regulator